MRLGLALRVFFKILFDSTAASRIASAIAESSSEPAAAPVARRTDTRPTKTTPERNDAIALLATLQREARFIDFVMESLDSFSDAQVGAAARDVHRQCRTVVERMFQVIPLSSEAEGAEVELKPGFDAAQWKLTGNVQGEPPFLGKQTHHGWKVTKCELPSWTGGKEAARIIAPVEVEIG